jgi:hypothetical protein
VGADERAVTRCGEMTTRAVPGALQSVRQDANGVAAPHLDEPAKTISSEITRKICGECGHAESRWSSNHF